MHGLIALPWYPALIAMTYMLSRLIVSWTPLDLLARPVLIAVPMILLAQWLVSSVFGRDQGGFLTALVVASIIDVRVALVVGVVGLGAWAIRRWGSVRLASRSEWPKVTRFLNAISAATLGVTIIGGMITGGIPLAGRPVAVPEADVPSSDAPDIYLLMLDGYPRADTLRDVFDFDQGPFFDAMATHGFEVSESAHSNYNKTMLTLSSVFNARHVTDLLPEPPTDKRAQVLSLQRLINTGAALTEARRLGYELISFEFQAPYATLTGADRVIDDGRMNVFDGVLLQTDLLRLALPQITDSYNADHRQRILDVFRGLKDLASEDRTRGTAAKPRLVFAHVAVPHPPFIFSADGSPSTSVFCGFAICLWTPPLSADQVAAVQGQVAFANRLVEDTARTIVEQTARPAVIVVFSDHGLRFDAHDTDETFRSLLMARTPGHPGLFPADASPINLLPRILNAYAAASLPLQPETEYVANNSVWTEDFFPLYPR